ncbi:MAG: DUF502 domain-containing protein [Firmicutes bacterium]|nr:DUF502 domain-containing protein [Bacillota bacterium]
MNFRKYLLAGLITLLPLVVTLWLLKSILSALIDVFRAPLFWLAEVMHLPVPPWWMLALFSGIATLLLLFGAGVLVGNFLGRQLLDWLDELMLMIPGIKGIYGATKQVLGAIQSGQGGSFKEVVVVEWPHPGSYTLGFLARRDCSWAVPGGESMVAVYIPTAPNPTSGYVIMLEESRVRPVDIRPEQAFTWAVSGGVVAPLPSALAEKP